MDRNKLEIRLCGLQRSGNHAVADWIIHQFKGKAICFLNNISHGDRDPFLSAAQIFAYNIEGIEDGQQKHFSENLRLANKDLLLYSYEDSAGRLIDQQSILSSMYSPDFENSRQQYLGESERFIDTLLLRDPYNFFASRIKRLEERTGVKDINLIIYFWKEMARQALEWNEKNCPDRILVRYNLWFSSKSYRKDLCEILGGSFSDESLGKVNPMGKGSSFDKTRYSKNLTYRDLIQKWYKLLDPRSYLKINLYLNQLKGAKRMKVLDRWQEMKLDERMLPIFEDSEIAFLSEQLFGKVI